MTHADWRCRARRPLVNLTGVVALGNGPIGKMWRRPPPRSHAPAGQGLRRQSSGSTRSQARRRSGEVPSSVARVRSRLLLPWPERARSRHRLVLERTLAERPPETARGLTSETTCVPRDRDAQRAARSARRARAPRLSQSRRNERRSRRGGCCRCIVPCECLGDRA
jgi:hypothetical protein